MMAKLNFQQPLLKSSVSHDPSEIILVSLFAAQETLLIIINVGIFVNTFFQGYLINKKFQRTVFTWNRNP